MHKSQKKLQIEREEEKEAEVIVKDEPFQSAIGIIKLSRRNISESISENKNVIKKRLTRFSRMAQEQIGRGVRLWATRYRAVESDLALANITKDRLSGREQKKSELK